MTKVSVKERKEKVLAAFENLLEKEGILSLLKLRASASLGRFSVGNILWLYCQAMVRDLPMPTMLLTFEAWHRLDRHVRKRGDEPSFYWTVLHPVTKNIWADEDDHSKGKYPVIVNWDITYEYDVKDTEGEPLPDLGKSNLESNDHFEQLLGLVEWSIFEAGYPVHWADDTGSAKGWFDPRSKEITLDARLSNDEALAVLVHELTHAICDTNYHDYTRADAEAITEFTTAIVCLGLGLDHLSQSVEYCAAWKCEDAKRAVLLLDKAEKCALQLEQALGLKEEYAKQEKAA